MLQMQGGMGSIPGGGTRSHMLQVRVYMPQLRPGTTNKYKIKKKKRNKEIQGNIENAPMVGALSPGDLRDGMLAQQKWGGCQGILDKIGKLMNEVLPDFIFS